MAQRDDLRADGEGGLLRGPATQLQPDRGPQPREPVLGDAGLAQAGAAFGVGPARTHGADIGDRLPQRLDQHRNIIVRDTGGGFGQKVAPQREETCVMLAARTVRHAVKWIEDRQESLMAAGMARHEHGEVRQAAASAPAASEEAAPEPRPAPVTRIAPRPSAEPIDLMAAAGVTAERQLLLGLGAAVVVLLLLLVRRRRTA